MVRLQHSPLILIQHSVEMKHGVALQQVLPHPACKGERGHVQTDGGLQQSGINDKDNCTIRAFAIGYGMPYKDAYKMGELAGREHGKGYWMYKIMDKAREFGYNSIELNGYGTLSAFLKKNNTGRFICVRRGHAFAVINGKIYDAITNKGQCKLIRIFKVESRGIKSYIQENFCV